eukprot:3932327-Rhodomonas_salina.1
MQLPANAVQRVPQMCVKAVDFAACVRPPMCDGKPSTEQPHAATRIVIPVQTSCPTVSTAQLVVKPHCSTHTACGQPTLVVV